MWRLQNVHISQRTNSTGQQTIKGIAVQGEVLCTAIKWVGKRM